MFRTGHIIPVRCCGGFSSAKEPGFLKMHIGVLSLSHTDAETGCIEQLTFDTGEATAFLHHIITLPDISEAALLCTCNRSELYTVSYSLRSPECILRRVSDELCTWKDLPGLPTGHRWFSDTEAVSHLFRVSAGIESMIPGENQILSQIKKAYRHACAARTNGTVLNKIFHIAFAVGKRSRAETNICVGAVSVSQAAVQMVSGEVMHPQIPVAVIGAGETSRLVCEHLYRLGFHDVTIYNRTYQNAVDLAERFCYRAARLNGWHHTAIGSGIIFAAVQNEHPIVCEEHIKAILAGAHNGSVTVVDLGLPRCVDPNISSVPGVRLFSIDDIRSRVECVIARRSSEIPQV